MNEPVASALLPAPDAALEACVVIAVERRQPLLGRCLDALARQTGTSFAAYEILLVLDDEAAAAMADEARRLAHGYPGLILHVLTGPHRGLGVARRVGMEAAFGRLMAANRPGGLIAIAEADGAVAPDWLRTQLDAVSAGARAVAGAAAALGGGGIASLSLTAETYAEIAKVEQGALLEDESLQRALERNGVEIQHSADVRVLIPGSAPDARLAAPVRLAGLRDWLTRRSYRGDSYELDRLLAGKATSVSVILPTREVAETIGSVLDVIAPIADAGLIDELVVVDAASEDGTADIAAKRGATVLQESELMPEFGPARGKGDAMWRGVSATTGEIVAFLDTDTEDFTPRFVLGLLGPIVLDPELALVKGAFSRPFRSGEHLFPEGGGRVTELAARPFLNLFVPELAGFVQPLAGEIAGRRSVFEAIPFPVGYGIETSMLIDVVRLVGIDAMGQSDLGTRQNRHQSLRALSAMAYAVLVAGSRRVLDPEAIDRLELGPLALPGGEELEIRQVAIDERPPLATLAPEARPAAPGLRRG